MRGTSHARRSAGLLAAGALLAGPAGCGAQASDREDRRCAVDRPTTGELTVGHPKTGDSSPTVILIPGSPEPTAPGDRGPAQTVRAEPAAVVDGPQSSTISYRFTGDGVVGWSAKSVAMGMTEGRSEHVPIAGPCTLQVDLSLSASDDENPGVLRADRRPDGSRVTDLITSGPRGGVLQSFVGTSATRITTAADGDQLVLTLR
ncbi:hypothetical protein [Tsukamurella sp. 1534]|uniref:hypothetical protein n=1 Tax=Tsukamurella sp. 1534 TaxID=1151061 RepID=UPI00031AB73D|nr:hypothetical protein [Tsukamurella sp. 1534]